MQTPTTIHITARTFTGKSFPIDVEPTHTVDELKALILAAGQGKHVKVPGLEYKGHELRDTRRVDHYGLAANDVLHIVPPSKVPKIALELVREDGSVFDITVSSGITVAKLKEEIDIEENIAVRQLKLVNSQRDGDGEEVVTLLEVQDDKAISEYSLEGQKVLVDVSALSVIDILVSVDDRIEDAEGSRIGVVVRLDQTMGSFKELLLNRHSFHCAEHSLILNGHELKDDEQTLGDLGVVRGCTVHAVAAVQFSVVTLAGKYYGFTLKATRRISYIRKLLREVDADVGDQDDCAFSLDGVHMLLESHTLWDLNIYFGTAFILKDRRFITLFIQYFGLASNFHERLGMKFDDKISIDGSASLDDLRAQILGTVPSSAKWIFQPPNQVYLSHRRRPLDGTRTIREERLKCGDVVDITLLPLERRIPEEVEEREQMDSDISLLAAHLSHLGGGYYARFERLADLADLENAITMEQQALALTPDGHPDKPARLTALGFSYDTRFERLGDLADIENAITAEMQALALTQDGHPDKPGHLIALGCSYYMRFERLGDLADLENAITTETQALALTLDGHPDKPDHLSLLGVSYSARFERLGDLADLENAITTQQQALALTSDNPDYLSLLGASYSTRFERLGDLADLENVITTQQQALALAPDDHPAKPAHLADLSTSYSARFKRLGDLTDLENAITMGQRVLVLTPNDHRHRPARVSNHSGNYYARFKRLGDPTDLENAIMTAK
ncbi:hypothetical protein FIBSPDRAFT_1044972 [Athelia psychrophila]|uniref:Ubiquitin-like domain-containing protein n=1 Tax=Athelia psychrophila TaxID=1759441 RepID=A0A166IZM1_9AGAM|nr:hypothetical protein FIBSPDRAFT_1044972 [Fibularhizoctonia sp. CBS 109695]